MSLKEALDKILDEGTEQLKAEGETAHVQALADALFRAATEPECEVRLTYKTTAMAAAAWTWMIWAAGELKMRDEERSSSFDVELTNGSGIMFWTDEGRPEVAQSG